MGLNLQHWDFCNISSAKGHLSNVDEWLSHYPVLLVVVTVMDNYKAQVKALAQVKQVVRLRFGPAIVM